MTRRIDLSGQWLLRWGNTQRGDGLDRAISDDPPMSGRSIDATVPGAVHLDLIKAGLIEEPGVGANCLKARWVEEFIWYYRRSFTAPRLRPGERAWMVFEALDLAAAIYLNGQLVARHANAFYPCRAEVTGQLKAGRNDVVVVLESGLYSVADKPPGDRRQDRLIKRQWLRTVQSTSGWDWSERLLNVGIRGGVGLEIASGVRFDRLVATAELSEDLRTGTVTARVLAEGLGARPRKGRLTVRITETGQQAAADVRIEPGLAAVRASVVVQSPELWWPVGHGRQRRYTVRAELTVAGQRVGQAECKVGFRRVRVNQDPHPDGGRYFVIEINNRPIFCKGGNFVPADLILARLDRRRYAALVERALEANFNMLRVWGGGLYESDDFYELCDRRGILVWQEFIFACARYPGHDLEFFEDVKREASYQVRRLAHHPSLIVWCGNNEVSKKYDDVDDQRSTVTHPTDFIYVDHAIYHHLLPIVVGREDGTRFYWPSSDWSPDFAPPRADHVGDQHPWTVGFSNTDFRDYRRMKCRFPDEGGILGPTALPTVRACLDGGGIGSFAWELHDNSVNSWKVPPQTDDMLRQWLGMDIERMSVEEYVYWAGAVQGEGLSEYVRNFRRRMFDSAAAVFWMYNDCWPMVRSWTVVDHYLRRTPAFWPVRRAFAPTTVALACEDGRVKVFGINDGPAWAGSLRFGLFALAGGRPYDSTIDVELPPNASAPLAELPLSALKRAGLTTHGAFALMLDARGREVARDKLLMPRFVEMDWPPAKPRVKLADGKATFSSRTFVWRVCLDLDGETPLPDNFFDVLPGIPTVLDWPAALGPPRILRVGNLPRRS